MRGRASREDVKSDFVRNIPQDLTLEDCLLEDFKDKTMEEQRNFFEKKMKEMAREGHKEDGWAVSPTRG